MYENINLLGTIASSFGDFARRTMRIVFTENELKTQILPPQRSFLNRSSLDEKKFQLVNGMMFRLCFNSMKIYCIFYQDAIRTKFKLDSSKYAAFYKNILRRKLSDFLIEERRRELKRIGRGYIRTQTVENHLD